MDNTKQKKIFDDKLVDYYYTLFQFTFGQAAILHLYKNKQQQQNSSMKIEELVDYYCMELKTLLCFRVESLYGTLSSHLHLGNFAS